MTDPTPPPAAENPAPLDDDTAAWAATATASPGGGPRRGRALPGAGWLRAVPALFAAAGLAAGGLALSWPDPAPTTTPPPPRVEDTPGPVATAAASLDLTGAEAALATLQKDAQALVAEAQAMAVERVGVTLESDLPDLMQQVRTARDARRKQRKSGRKVSLSAPFDADELEGAAKTLRLSPSRFVIGRDGTVTLPSAAKLPPGLDLSSDKPEDTDRRVQVLSETDETLTVVARACLPYEKHCLVEVRTLDKLALDSAPLKAALGALTPVPAAPAAPAPPAAKAPTLATPAPYGHRVALFALSALLLLGALATGWGLRRAVEKPVSRLDDALHHLAAGEPLPDDHPGLGLSGARAVRRTLNELAPRADKAAALTRALHQLAADLSAAAQGAFDHRGDLDDSPDEDVRAVARAAHQLLDAVQEHTVRVARLPADKHQERIDRLRPVPQLLQDVAKRLQVLAGKTEGPLAQELHHLAGQVAPRAVTVTKLLDKLAAPSAGHADGFGQDPFALLRGRDKAA